MKRNFKGLIKFASIIKQADPPHRGLNDTNPFIRHAHRTYGWVPQAPDSYFSGFNSPEDFYKQTAETIYTVGKENPATDGYWGNNNSLNRELYDYFTSAGSNKNSIYYPERGITLGSYPYDRKTIALHELGHGHDPMLSKLPNFPFDILENNAETHRSPLGKEIFAWDWAGIPKDNPIRVAALNAYKNKNYSKIEELSRKLEEEASHDNESWRSIDPVVNINNVPIGNRVADDKRLVFMTFPRDYLERYSEMIPYLKELHTRYNDYPPDRLNMRKSNGTINPVNVEWNWHHIYPDVWEYE